MKARLVVCDTSPIRVLDHLTLLELLEQFFTEVLIPPAIARELEASEGRFRAVRLTAIPNCRVEAPKDLAGIKELEAEIHTGEAEALVLARELSAELLIDERAGRIVARRLGIRHTGVIGLLVRAKQEGMISQVVPLILQARDEMNFYVSEAVIEDVRRLADE